MGGPNPCDNKPPSCQYSLPIVLVNKGSQRVLSLKDKDGFKVGKEDVTLKEFFKSDGKWFKDVSPWGRLAHRGKVYKHQIYQKYVLEIKGEVYIIGDDLFDYLNKEQDKWNKRGQGKAKAMGLLDLPKGSKLWSPDAVG